MLRHFVLTAIALISTVGSMADEAVSFRADLADRIKSEIDALDPNQIPEVDSFVLATISAMEEVERSLNQTAGAAGARAWLDYLRFDPLRENLQQWSQIHANSSAREAAEFRAETAELINSLLARTTINYPGLELAHIPELRRAVRMLDRMTRYRLRDKTISYVRRIMEGFVKRLRSDDEIEDASLFFQLDELNRLLRETNQAASLTQWLRAQFAQPNLTIGIGSDLVDDIVSRPFSEPSPVNECLFGTRLVGNSVLTGTISSRLLPARGTARIELLLQGTLSSTTRGYHRPITLDADGYGNVTASKELTISESGVSTEPAIASATVSSRIRRINHPLRIVRRIAMNQAQKDKGRTNTESARRLERKVADGFDEQVASENPLGDGGTKPVQEFVKILNRFGVAEPTRYLSSESRYILTTLAQQGHWDLAAPIGPPVLTGTHSIALQIHETIVNNIMTEVIAGRTLTTRQVGLIIKSIMPEAEVKANGEEFAAIEMSRTRPIVFEARNDSLRMGFRAVRFITGAQDRKKSLEVVAEYTPVRDASGAAFFQREGEIQVATTGTRDVEYRVLKEKIQVEFERIFPERLLDEPIKLPIDELSGRQIRPREIAIADGWLTLGMR